MAAILLAAQIPMELRYEGWELSLPLRLLWVALILAAVPLVREERPRLAELAAYGCGLGSGLLGTGIIAVTGGSSSPRFGFLLAFPLVVLVLAPGLPGASMAMGLATGAGGLAILLSEGREAWYVIDWLILWATASGLALLGTLASRRLFASELRARTGQAEAVARLAEAERAAAVGRVASAVAHRVSNPLAVVKGNLQFLEGCRDVAALDPEARQALAESIQGVDRVSRVLMELRGLAPARPEATSPCDAAELVGAAVAAAAEQQPRLSVRQEVPTGLPAVLVDRQGVVLALASILMEASEGDGPPLRVVGTLGAGHVRLVVSAIGEAARGGGGFLRAPARAEDPDGLATHLALVRERAARSGATLEASLTPAGDQLLTLHLPFAPDPRR